jgi:tartrate-resistant acid phosphatase type 5
VTHLLLIAALVLAQHNPATLRLAVVGDTGNGAEKVARGIARLHAQSPFDAIVLTGDTFYPCGVTSPADPRWSLVKPLTAIGAPVYPVLGNHDYCGKSKPDAQIGAPVPNWHFPAREYVVHSTLADFVIVDTTPFALGNKNTVTATIRDGFASSHARWRIAVGHHSIVSSGWHGRFPKNEHARMLSLIDPLRAAKVDLYMCGHDHHLELLDTNPRMLVSGAGSAPIPPVARRQKTLWPSEMMRTIGFAVVELTQSTMTIRFYDANGDALSKPFSFVKE